MTGMNLHMYTKQMTGFEVWMKECHRSPFREEKENFCQLCGAFYHHLERLKGNSKFPKSHLAFRST